jgi:uncharacterized membrane protein
MKPRDFWSGFAAGASTVVAGVLIAGKVVGGDSPVVRLEKSLQIARPVEEVFDTWIDFEELARSSHVIEEVRVAGNRSHWTANLNGARIEWDAELTQIIPNQSVGWKSLEGPQHSGRVTFSPLGNDTLVHVQMNYAPPARFLRRLLSPFAGEFEGYVEQALRDFKAGLERTARRDNAGLESGRNSDPSNAHWNVGNDAAHTGTYAPGPELLTKNQNAKFGEPSVPVEYTRPPEAKL